MGFSRWLHFAGTGVALAAGVDRPAVVLAALTHRCNLRCRYCGVWHDPGPEMDTATWASLLGEARRAGTVSVSFCGGEPLLRADLGDLVRRAARLGLRTSLTTNGWFVTERGDDLGPLDALTISLDGPEEVHDASRGPGSHRRALAAISWARSQGKAVYTATVLSGASLQAAEWVCRTARDLGFLPFFQPATPYVFSGDEPGDWAPGPSELRGAGERLEALRAKGLPVGNSAEYLRALRDGVPPGRTRPCMAGRRFLTVLPDGRLVPCHITATADALRYSPGGFARALASMPRPHCEGCMIAPYVEYDTALRLPTPGRLLRTARVLFGRR